MNSDSEDCEILIKAYAPDSTSEKYFCVDLNSGGIDFFSPEVFEPTRFVLNIPGSQVVISSC